MSTNYNQQLLINKITQSKRNPVFLSNRPVYIQSNLFWFCEKMSDLYGNCELNKFRFAIAISSLKILSQQSFTWLLWRLSQNNWVFPNWIL